ncbi:hypothetical protein ACJMK2_016362 [Sinanodonta woodiana]|uniref:EF-hand domain-containing protein n=1 Tax=Sinanodonta woodiana TaxID=1069815 RepID=A0ABD3UWU8_SINWO
MKVVIKLVALLLYLILAAMAAPKGKRKEVGGENDDAEAIATGGEGKDDEAGEQGKVGKVWKMGEMGEAGDQGAMGEAWVVGEMGEEQGVTEGGEAGVEGGNAVTVKLPNYTVRLQPPIVVTPTNEEPKATDFVTEADTIKQKAGVSSSVLPEVAPSTPETSIMLQVTTDDFSYLDQNGDGFLDYKEVFLGQNNANPVYLNAAFQISDKNFDGVVDKREFFRHPLSWGRVVAEKQFFAKDISTSGSGTSETLTSQLDVTPTAEQTYTASRDGTSPPLPEDNVTTIVPSAEQNTTVLTAVDQQPSGPTDTSTRAHVSVIDQANGSQSVALPKVTQRQKEVANGKAGSQVGSESEAGTGSVIGNRTGYMARDCRRRTGVVSNGNQTTASKEEAVAGSTGGQTGMATGQTDQKRTGAESSGGQPSGVSGSVGCQGQRGGYDQKNGQAGFGGAAGRHAVTVTGKTGGLAKSHGVQHRTKAVTHTTGVQSGVSVHPSGKFHGRTVAHCHPQTAPVSWPVKAQGHAGPQYHRWDGHKWIKTVVEQEAALEVGSSFYGKPNVGEYNGIAKSAGMEKKYLPDLRKVGTEAAVQSEEEEEEESRNEAKDNSNKNGKGNGDNESDDIEDNDEMDIK